MFYLLSGALWEGRVMLCYVMLVCASLSYAMFYKG